MKSDTNTEMELLLRRHARLRSRVLPGASDAASPSDETTATSGMHLDADEMNAYAEGEMPPAARAHALSHIADCDRCRALVTNLTLAANVPVKDTETDAQQQQQQAASPKRDWREWLAVLFAPPVIRYGVPALLALCVVGVVFLTLRQREAERLNTEPPLVARNDQREGQTASALKPEATPTTLASPTERPGEQPAPAQPKDVEAAQTPVLTDTQDLAKTKQTNEATPSGATRADAPATATINSNDSSGKQEAARDQRDEDFAAAAPRPAAPPSAMSQPSAGARAQEPTETDRLSQNPKESAPRDNRSATTTGAANNTATRESEEKTGSLGRSSQATQARSRAARRPQTMTEGSGTGSSSSGGAGERSSETRSVGGRKFKRQGSAWVDTAYASGRATVNVTRGSEQYRALVADEPGLRTIADQLGGEVIVVWRGRAYRIH